MFALATTLKAASMVCLCTVIALGIAWAGLVGVRLLFSEPPTEATFSVKGDPRAVWAIDFSADSKLLSKYAELI